MTRSTLAFAAAAALLAAATHAGPPQAAQSPAAQSGGDVTVVAEAIVAGSAFAPKVVAADPVCVDPAYTTNPWKLAGTFKWYYNPANAPASVAATALDALKTGTKNVIAGQNRCGLKPTLTMTEQYVGTSTKVAQVSSTGACTGNDNVSVTSWGDLPATTLAYTCTYYATKTGAVQGSDMLIDNKLHEWFTTMPASCNNKFDLLAVVAHERGHTVGLGHVDQATHGLETMSPNTRPCDVSERLLGGGDMAGLISLYAK